VKATRDGFGDQLAEMADSVNLVVLNADLSDATRLKKFASIAPERYFDLGIAEANMVGVASGLAAFGFKVVVPSFAAFITGRYDMIRCSLAYPNKPVLIVGTHAGMAIGRDGVTQMGLEDINLMRGMPNMSVIQPATYNEARAATKFALRSDKLIYLRLGRQPVREFFVEDCKFEFGRGLVCWGGESVRHPRVTLISSGCTLGIAKKAAEILHATLINIPTLKPIDDALITKYAAVSALMVTIEDHSIVGGLGSAVAEVLAEAGSHCPLLRMGIKDQFVESGAPDDLYEKYGLTTSEIVAQVRTRVPEYVA
jgi:transketolase